MSWSLSSAIENRAQRHNLASRAEDLALLLSAGISYQFGPIKRPFRSPLFTIASINSKIFFAYQGSIELLAVLAQRSMSTSQRQVAQRR